MRIGTVLQEPYNYSYEVVSKLWNKAEQHDRLVYIAMRASSVALGIILFPLTYPFALLGKLINCVFLQEGCGFRNTSYQKGQELSLKIEALRQSGDPGWKERAVSIIRKSREGSLDDEWERLKGAGAITPTEQNMIKNAVGNVYIKDVKGMYDRKKQAQVLLGQVHEIKKLYGDTHHVFTHGQSLTCSVIPLLIKELIRKYSPDKAAKNFKFLRNEQSAVTIDKVGLIDRVKDLFGMSANTPPAVWDYLNQFLWISDDDHRMREMLLSADGYLYNNQSFESALFFLMNNSNILGSNYKGSLTSIVESIISHFKKDASPQELKKASKQVMKSILFTQNMITTGKLYAIAIPKEQSKKVQYRAHPFGKVCDCHAHGHTKILEKLQQGTLDASTRCYDVLNPVPPIPQYRLYTKALTPENGCKIYRMTPLSRDSWRSVKSSIKRVVSDLSA